MTPARGELTQQLMQLREDRELLLASARRHVAAARRAVGDQANRTLPRMHLALARHRLYLARELNRRLVACKRALRAAGDSPS
jgi:hypothetical protein